MKRKYLMARMLKTSVLLYVYTSFFCLVSSLVSAQTSERLPNIIIILADDMGYGQPPSYNPRSALRTPNLDRFAQQGMRFTDAHSAAAVCTPSRYGLLTGRYPARIGQYGVLTTFSKPIIPTSRLTIASLLKKKGYSTACIGKWHLGLNWIGGDLQASKEIPVGTKIEDGPNALGFDYFLGFTHARSFSTIIEQDSVLRHVGPEQNQPLMISKAVEWIDQQANSSDPFFLYFPMCPPHTPIVPSADYLGKSGAQDLVKNNSKYGDWLYQGDAMIGKILEALDRNHLADHTLVIVASDNGAEHRAYEPLRESKRSIYEGGHRVPFIVRWPGKVKPATLNDHTVCLNDLLATAAEIVGTKLPDNAGEDSHSLLSEFLGNTENTISRATIHQSAYGDLAIRQGPWKLVFLSSNKRELYHMQDDLSETKDISAVHPDIVENMTLLMNRYIENGRSTLGEKQLNESVISITGKPDKGKTKEKRMEERHAQDASFD